MLANKLMGGSEDTLYVDDVFSTYLYTGNGSTQTINNGIDLAGEGGLVWVKERANDGLGNHYFFDTARTISYSIQSNENAAEASRPNHITGYNSNGFGIGLNSNINNTDTTYASWTFRKAPKFFDVVTWTGTNASARSIPHSLGSVPGCIVMKCTSTTSNWPVYHKDIGLDPTYPRLLNLNTTDSVATSSGAIWGGTPTSTTFTVGGDWNINGATYVAYLFAHDDSADGIIQCGSFSGDTSVNTGWEPQFVVVKRSDNIGNWLMQDTMRGIATGGIDATLFANLSDAENTSSDRIDVTATGFDTKYGAGTYIYLAIRRPNKPPTSGTEVFTPYEVPASPTTGAITGFVTDAGFIGQRAGVDKFYWGARLMGNPALNSTNTNAESPNTNQIWDRMNGWWNSAINGYMTWGFKRAPGFMDVVCYTGTGAAMNVAHNLTVVPELMIVKPRNNATLSWAVYSGNSDQLLQLNFDGAQSAATAFWGSMTASTFGINNANYRDASLNYVAYLFASLPGIQWINSYVGDGTTGRVINCGFTTGARFVLIKRTDSTGDWYVWDAARGIVAANDPYLSLNTTAAEVTTDDSVDPESSGFIVNQNTATNINVNGGSYIFLAIA